MNANEFKLTPGECKILFLALFVWTIEGSNKEKTQKARDKFIKIFVHDKSFGFKKLRTEIRCLSLLFMGRDPRKVRATYGRKLSKTCWKKVTEIFRCLGPAAEGRLNEGLMIQQGLQPYNFVAPPRRLSYEHLDCP